MLGNDFGGMLDKMEAQQKELHSKLSSITVEAEAEKGAIKVTASANKELVNISIDPTKMDMNDVEQLEDLLLIAVNRALALAGKAGAAETQSILKEMLPGGMGGLDSLFGK